MNYVAKRPPPRPPSPQEIAAARELEAAHLALALVRDKPELSKFLHVLRTVDELPWSEAYARLNLIVRGKGQKNV